jgi:hypothetical protein
MESKHTQLPYRIRYDFSAPTFSVYAAHRQVCNFSSCTKEDLACAQFIVKACNSYYEREAALIMARDALQRSQPMHLKGMDAVTLQKLHFEALTKINEVLS